MNKIFTEKYDLLVDDLYNPAYQVAIYDDEKAEKVFETLKKSAYHTEWFEKKPHCYNGDDNCETGFFIGGYYVSFMMMDDHFFSVRVHVACIDIDIYTSRKELYMLDLNSSLTDFEKKFGKLV